MILYVIILSMLDVKLLYTFRLHENGNFGFKMYMYIFMFFFFYFILILRIAEKPTMLADRSLLS